jgi:hypothetical protein
MRRLLTLMAVLASASSVASAYYHWTYFASRSGPFQELRLRFDLASLPDSTVSFFVAKQGPAKMVAGDNFTALVSQIRRAGETWNVPSSALKIKFGGLQEKPFADILTEQVTPGIDVVFDDDLPPGVLAYAQSYSYTDLAYLGAANGPGFMPILRSRLQLASDLTVRSQASYSDAFFLTMVHEFGHTLGLQHSMTAGVMATSVLRGTSRAVPLAADDVAGISVLYPTAKFQASTGSITGHVNVLGIGANLASVVALGADGTAIGAMSLPDGSYHIDGVPAGDYLIYAHPLPAALLGEASPAGIRPPLDLANNPFPVSAEFRTRFFPDAQDWKEAQRLHVNAGQALGSVDFGLQPLAGAGIYNLQVYGLFGPNRNLPVHAPPLVPGFTDYLAFHAEGAQISGHPVQGLQVSAISDTVVLDQQSLRDYPGQDQFSLIIAKAGAVGRATPVAMSLTVGENLYVLPGAFSQVPSKHPLLTGVAASFDDRGQLLATITGENLIAGTRVSFDGADALSVRVKGDGSLEAVVPAAVGPQQAAVEVFNADGQTSWQVQGSAPPVLFSYDAPVDPVVSMSPGSLMAGTNAMLEIDGVFTNFAVGKTAVGFGTSDVVVRQMWVLAPGKLLVNVAVSPNAKLGNIPVTVSTGIQLVTLGAPLQIRPPEADQSTLLLPIVNAATGLPGAPSGATMSMRVTGLPADIRGWLVIVNGVRTPLTRTDDGRLLAPIAGGIQAGPQIVQLIAPSGPPIPPVLFQIDTPPPSVSVSAPAGLLASASPAVQFRAGDRVSLVVSNLLVTNAGDGVTPTNDDVEVHVAGISQRPDLIAGLADGNTRLEFVVPAGVPPGEAQPVTVIVGTRVSAAVTLVIIP